MKHWFLFVLMMIGSCLAAAENPLQISLVSEVRSIQPGRPFHLALALEHPRGFHTYWKIPGIVGVPTNIRWTDLPKGWKSSEILWPEPELTHMFKIKAQGYERDVALPMLITPPANLKDGSSVTLTGKASWMCCGDQCFPGFKGLSITLPVKVGAEPDFDPKWQQRIAAELARPVMESTRWKALLSLMDKEMELTLTPLAGAKPLTKAEVKRLIYFTEDGVVDSDKPQSLTLTADGGLHLKLQVADTIVNGLPKDFITGVLVRENGWHDDGSLRALRVKAAH